MKYHLPLELPEHLFVRNLKTGQDFNNTLAGKIVEKQFRMWNWWASKTSAPLSQPFWSSSLVAPAAGASCGKAGPFGALPFAL